MTIKIEIQKDFSILRYFFAQNDIKLGIFDGKDIDFDDFTLTNDILLYLFRYCDEKAGFCAFKRFSDDSFIVDVAFMPKFRGKIAIKISKIMINKFFNENKCNKMVTMINKNNKKSLLYTLWLGFKKVLTINQYDWLELKNGRTI